MACTLYLLPSRFPSVWWKRDPINCRVDKRLETSLPGEGQKTNKNTYRFEESPNTRRQVSFCKFCMESRHGHVVHYIYIVPLLHRWCNDNGAMIWWRWCDDALAMLRWQWCDMTMKRCSIAPSLLRHRTLIVIASSHHRAIDFFLHVRYFHENGVRCE